MKTGDLIQPRRMNVTLKKEIECLEVFDDPSEMGDPICRWKRGELGIFLGVTEDEGDEMAQVLVGSRKGWVDVWCVEVFNVEE